MRQLGEENADKTVWHKKEISDALADLDSFPGGLSSEEAQRRLVQYGPNELKEKTRAHPFMIFLAQFRDFMILVLIAAAIISGFIGEFSDTLAIIVIVLINAVIGFLQEYRAEKAMAALKKMAASYATVLRDGSLSVKSPASGLVPGDIVMLEAGRTVPADLRLIESFRLKVEEAALTGESVPVDKQTKALHDEHLPVGDRTNMAFKGTFATYGRAQDW